MNKRTETTDRDAVWLPGVGAVVVWVYGSMQRTYTATTWNRAVRIARRYHAPAIRHLTDLWPPETLAYADADTHGEHCECSLCYAEHGSTQ